MSIKNSKKHLSKVKKNYLTMKLTHQEIKAQLISRLNDLNVGVDEENDE